METLRIVEPPKSPLLNDRFLAQITQGRDEPDWLRDLRREAWAQARISTLPNRRAEHWRFTELRGLSLTRFSPPEPPRAPGELPAEFSTYLAEREVEEGETVRLNLVNFEPVGPLPETGQVRVMTFTQAVAEAPELLRRVLKSLAQRKFPHSVFSLAQQALTDRGLIVHLPAGESLSAVLEVNAWLDPGEGRLVAPLIAVVAEKGSRGTIYLDLTGPAEAEENLVLPSLAILTDQEAELTLVHKQTLAQSQWVFATRRIELAPRARLKVLEVSVGGRLARTETTTEIAGQGSEVELLGITFAGSRQQINHYVINRHSVGEAHSDLLYKTAVGGRGRYVFYGNIVVEKNCDLTNAYLANRNLLLSDQAKVNTMPTLEIMSNDVRCTHGATVGKLDEEMRFYLLSRGIPPGEAQKLLVFGFFGEVLKRIEDPFLRKKVDQSVARNIERIGTWQES